jgi:hypothetical protein
MCAGFRFSVAGGERLSATVWYAEADALSTAASLAIASGANVKVVQQMLGHKSAVMTLDLYGHLFGDQLDDVADRLDSAARADSSVPFVCPPADVVDLSSRRATR